MRIFDIPYSDPSKPRNYRSFKLKFQAPPGVGLFTWRIYIVSDTFVGEDVDRDISVRNLPFSCHGHCLPTNYFVCVNYS